MKKRIFYLISFLVIFCIEVLIALYVCDNFVRPYIGDVPVSYTHLEAPVRSHSLVKVNSSMLCFLRKGAAEHIIDSAQILVGDPLRHQKAASIF